MATPPASEPENLVLHLLRRIDSMVLNTQEEMRDVKQRLGSLENQVTGMRVDLNRLEHRMDRFDDRLSRIEKRLDLVEA